MTFETITSEAASQAGSPADHRTTLAQIGRGTLMACGARDFVHDDPHGMLMFRVGKGGQVVTKVVIRLMADDTYTVERGSFTMKPSAEDFGVWRVEDQEVGIYCDGLADSVRRLGDR
jgi:hypothetical protein